MVPCLWQSSGPITVANDRPKSRPLGPFVGSPDDKSISLHRADADKSISCIQKVGTKRCERWNRPLRRAYADCGHTVRVRVTSQRAATVPDGATGWHSVSFTVS